MLKTDPDILWRARPTNSEQLQKPERAIADFVQQQLKWEPLNAETWRRLGASYLQTRQFGLAQKAVQRAIDLSPDNVASYQLDALLAKERGNWQDELHDLDRMLVLDPNNQWAKAYKPVVVLRLAAVGSPLRSEDTYSVYSSVLAHPVFDHADNDSILLIAGRNWSNLWRRHGASKLRSAPSGIQGSASTKFWLIIRNEKTIRPVLRHAFTFLVPIGY